MSLAIAVRAGAAEPGDVRIDPVQTEQAAANARLDSALSRKISVEFDATPLSEVLSFVARLSGVEIILSGEMTAEGKKTVTLKARETELRSVLEQALAPSGLKWSVRQGAVFVSAPAAAGEAPPAPPARPAARPGDEVVEFVQSPASEIVSFVAERSGVNIVIDPNVREKLKTPVTFKTKGMTYRQVLDWALKLCGAAWVLADGAVFVTTQENVPKVDVNEAVRKFIADNPKFFTEPAQFEPPPDLGFPKMK